MALNLSITVETKWRNSLALSVDGFENLLPLILRFFGRDTEVRARSRDNDAVIPTRRRRRSFQSRWWISPKRRIYKRIWKNRRVYFAEAEFGARRPSVYIVGRVLIVNFNGGASLPLLDKSSVRGDREVLNLCVCIWIHETYKQRNVQKEEQREREKFSQLRLRAISLVDDANR